MLLPARFAGGGCFGVANGCPYISSTTGAREDALGDVSASDDAAYRKRRPNCFCLQFPGALLFVAFVLSFFLIFAMRHTTPEGCAPQSTRFAKLLYANSWHNLWYYFGSWTTKLVFYMVKRFHCRM